MMAKLRAMRALPPAVELALVLALAWLALAGMPLSRGELGISWDALNHQVYLGWTATGARFQLDVLPASYQSYQYPYLYWPLYQLAAGGFSGRQAGAALATLQLVCVPPLWIVARACIPEDGWFAAFMRLLAVALAFSSGLVISLFHSTSNDMLATAPLLWAVALVFPGAARSAREPGAAWKVVLSGLLAGASVALKLSNGPLALVLPLLWLLLPGDRAVKWKRAAAGCMAVLVGCALAYSPWGWELWKLEGNPIYPMADQWFAPLRTAVGWRP